MNGWQNKKTGYLLQPIVEQQAIMRMRLGEKYYASDFVCTWKDGKPFNPSHVSRALGQRLKKLGLPKIRFHVLRHSNASLMIAQGAPMKAASERLGHSTIQIIQDIYGPVERSVQEQIAQTIDKAIRGISPSFFCLHK